MAGDSRAWGVCWRDWDGDREGMRSVAGCRLRLDAADLVEDAGMKTFKSLNDLVWWLQNNGGGDVQITVSPSTGENAVVISAGNGEMRVRGKGRFLKSAMAELNGEGA